MRIDTEPTLVTADGMPRSRGALAVTIIAAVTAALVGGSAVAAYAYFTSQATVTGQDVATATVEIVAGTASSSSPITATDLLPGDSETTEIVLENTGSADVYYSLRLPKTTGDPSLEAALQVAVVVGALSETRSLTDWQMGTLQVGDALAVGSTQTVTVTLSLPSSAGNSLQGTSAGFAVRFDAVQQRNTTPPTAGWVND